MPNIELHILSTVDSPFILKQNGAFQDMNNLYIVLDYLPGGELS